LHKWEVHGDHFCSRCNLLKPQNPCSQPTLGNVLGFWNRVSLKLGLWLRPYGTSIWARQGFHVFLLPLSNVTMSIINLWLEIPFGGLWQIMRGHWASGDAIQLQTLQTNWINQAGFQSWSSAGLADITVYHCSLRELIWKWMESIFGLCLSGVTWIEESYVAGNAVMLYGRAKH
jgi:hypothetical protein